jgi:hypothetical protein
MLDADLAELYGVPTRVLIQSVQRNAARFPDDFMFQLSVDEASNSRSQIVISSWGGWGGRRSLPYAFTEHGVAMLSSVLRSHRAIAISIAIMRAFVQMRQMLMSNESSARKLDALEKRYDAQFKSVFDAIRELMSTPRSGHSAIGFRPRARGSSSSRAGKLTSTRGAVPPPPSPERAGRRSS